MLYVTKGALEACKADKHRIKIVCPDIWIHYVVSGKGYYNDTLLTAGKAFIVYKNDLCEYYPHKNDPWTYVWVRFSGSDDENLLKRCSMPTKSGVFDFDYVEGLTALAPVVFSAVEKRAQNLSFNEAVAKMILSLNVKKIAEISPSRDEAWVIKAKEYIAANYHTRLTVEQIAGALHIDRQYLRNLFVKYTGMSTKQYLDFYRMKRAVELLCITQNDVNVIAASVGYSDSLAFSKAFKKHYGVSPTKYRNKL
ncbi:MAG: AraC family transcriptional regulator [Clostridia bacterium]|nr:AraC family transcriptional regulator [Clostridia bacterium]